MRTCVRENTNTERDDVVANSIEMSGSGGSHGRLSIPTHRPPFHTLPPPPFYPPGDQGRFMADGQMEIIGRVDFMVKIRGYSVVLGAVEAALAKHPSLSSAVVVTEGAEGEDKRVVAYVVPKEWGGAPSASSVRLFLKDHLPMYAIPSVFILLDQVCLLNISVYVQSVQ